ncbi:MAG TPA: phosphatase PAP2 family protein [Frankiaceae bacterium]|nr:phosphatase PAP2 family protein [Frankiaceae bacterium]
MPHWVPSWQLAVTVAGCVGVVSAGLRVWMRGKTGTRERRVALAGLIGWQAAVLVAAYGLWQFTGSKALVGTTDGIDRGRHLWNLERDLHLPSEASFQRLFLPHHTFVRFLNLYYVVAHYNVLLIMLAWLIWRHRDRYAEARTVILLATFACLAVQLIPVAPPRLIGGHGIVDTPSLYGQSVYGPIGQGFSDQYSAMPSVHIAWSSAVAFFVWRSTKSRWRYLGVVHALLTWTVVIATGNHYWLDGIVAIAILALSFWTVRLGTYLRTRVSQWVTWIPAPAALAASGVAPALVSLPPPLPAPSLDAAATATPTTDLQAARASPPPSR